ncbi:hypothetical protein Ga0100231_002525 [Opitutaceae bacterium TAV4]|uniref:TPR end-of-group domain-containing protein n=1 Tax=Geminisphaera colitermitum TaxID=1148786 RepID=UPI000158D136|nr:hypothetical protein [Geminisphaera colitermitum]RRJ97019.1 hypothetical protein Ga0100231_025100 [Opitutaceae bacterium TAV4]RRJ97436.1 hypothetical protein Ga0100231_002525 [Opitutaceae bacterium TAV4]RRK01817.1 hypothetical protein Ga0100230_000665 [Opitutaceae bacterium TAV3]
MSRKEDIAFDIDFYESVLRRDSRYTDVIELLGGLYTKAGRIADGLKMDRKLVRLQPGNATAHYNLACSLALIGNADEAIKSLTTALERGYEDHEWMLKDDDLATLRPLPEFSRLLAQVKAAAQKQA